MEQIKPIEPKSGKKGDINTNPEPHSTHNPKLRLIFYENKKQVLSYFHIEKTESARVIKILKLLQTSELKKWTPISAISEKIDSKIPATLWTVQKLAGAKRIDVKMNDKRVTIAKSPVLLLRKEQHNTRNNLRKQKYLKPTVYVKAD